MTIGIWVGDAPAPVFGQLKKIFAGDAGLGTLVEYNGRPDMDPVSKEVQECWLRFLNARHSPRGVAREYARYYWARQAEMQNKGHLIRSRADVVEMPVLTTPRSSDLYDFLCRACRNRYPSVMVNATRPTCTPCAAEAIDQGQAVPLWTGYAHCPYAEGSWDTSWRPLVEIRTGNGEYVTVTAGDLGVFESSTCAFVPGSDGWTSTMAVREESGHCRADCKATLNTGRVSVSITATLACEIPRTKWDPGSGFTLVDAHVITDDGVSTHHDVYSMAGVVISALHPATA